MAEVKIPLLSFAATGTLGPLHFSHHNRKTYVYATSDTKAKPPTPAQEAVRRDFTDGVARWNAFTPAEKYFWTQLAPRLWHPQHKPIDTPPLTGYQCYIQFWRSIEAEPGKFLIFLAAWIAIALKFAIPLPF